MFDEIANEIVNNKDFFKNCNDSMFIHVLIAYDCLLKGVEYHDATLEEVTKNAIIRLYGEIDNIDKVNEAVLKQVSSIGRYTGIKENIDHFNKNVAKWFEEKLYESQRFADVKTRYDLRDWTQDLLHEYVLLK